MSLLRRHQCPTIESFFLNGIVVDDAITGRFLFLDLLHDAVVKGVEYLSCG